MVQGATASGSGVLISSTLLVTSAHVIGTQGAVQVTFADNSALTAQVVFADSTSDVAVLQLGSPDSTLVPLPIGETEGLDNGARVTAVGYPGGRMSKLATQLTSKTATQLLTTGAADPGISGGALLSDDEHLIGVIGATRELGWRSDPGHIWAIPMQVVRKVCRDHGVPLE
jgi:putative serine protease PepD